MAEELLSLGQQLAAETTCPLCLDVLAQPVLTACGHSFCRQCLAAVLGQPPRPAACPLCRAAVEPGSPRPNLPLANVAGLARALGQAAGRPRCPQHGKLLALFRELCDLCCDGPQRPPHRGRPAEEAAGERPETLQNNLHFVQKQKEKLKLKEVQKSSQLLRAVMSQSKRVCETFEELQRFLEEQEQTLLAQLHQVSKELLEKWRDYNHRLFERWMLLGAVMVAIEEKQDLPVDADKIPSSWEPVFPELQRSIENISEVVQQVVDLVAKLKVNLQSKIDGKRGNVTLDPETAGPFVVLSQDCKSVRCGDGNPNLPDIPKRFSNTTVLGSQRFMCGRQYWEVEGDKENGWDMGVALEPLPRKEPYVVPMCKEIWTGRTRTKQAVSPDSRPSRRSSRQAGSPWTNRGLSDLLQRRQHEAGLAV